MLQPQQLNTAPVLRRRLVLNDLENNHNKFWEVVLYANGEMHTTWGRVGITPPAPKIERGDVYHANKKASEKLAKGYTEVDLHKVATVNGKSTAITVLDPRLESLVSMIYKEAGKKRDTYLSVPLDELSPAQITKARAKLVQINNCIQNNQNCDLPLMVQAYYNLIPTKLPARIDVDTVVKSFVTNMGEQEQRLNQLEAGLKSVQLQQSDNSSDLAALGGVVIKPLDQTQQAYSQIYDYVISTSKGITQWRVKDIFTVHIPNERAAYNGDTFGKHHIAQLFHGTRNYNLQYILNEGLKIPQTAANGWRFGPGIYCADHSARSLGYVAGNHSSIRTLLVCDVALGDMKKMDGQDEKMRQAPKGYHSVWGTKSFSGMDEFICYKPSQVTIRAIVSLE